MFVACNSRRRRRDTYVYLLECCASECVNRIHITFHTQNTNEFDVPDVLFWTQSQFVFHAFVWRRVSSQLNFTSDHEHVHNLRCTNIRLFFPFFVRRSKRKTTTLTASTITATDIFRGPFLLNFAPFCLR